MSRDRFQKLTTAAVVAYAAAAVGLWLMVDVFADRWWLATLIAFGPRWIATLPLAILFPAIFVMPRRKTPALLIVLTLSAVVVVFGIMDFRAGGRRTTEPVALRLLTYNLAGVHVTSAAMHVFLVAERIDVAALQECPFSTSSLESFGWHFFYGGDLCLVSRYPFKVLDVHDPDTAWRYIGTAPLRFEIDTPGLRFEVLNVHFSTIRAGVEALAAERLQGLTDFALNRRKAAEDSRAARARISRSSAPLIVAGDFNLPVESRIYRDYWGEFENAFSSCGRGFGHTKFTWLFGIRIDHVLMSPHWTCTNASVLPPVSAGDHVPLIVDLALSAELPD